MKSTWRWPQESMGMKNTPYKIYKYNINNLIYSFVVEFSKNRGGKYQIGYLKKFEIKYNKNIWLTLTFISLWNFTNNMLLKIYCKC